MDTKGVIADLSSKANALLVGAPYIPAGCCGVIEPDLSATLDNYSINLIVLQVDSRRQQFEPCTVPV